jgi:transposase
MEEQMVTNQQIRRLFKLIQTEPTADIAAAKAGMTPKTARKYLSSKKLPSELAREHTWRTREDPFEQYWAWCGRHLELNPGLQAKTLFEALQREHPGRFQDGQLRTLQRRLKLWRATEGPSREVFFDQVHHPGELCQSDFTHMSDLGVMIGGQRFEHLCYHFVLTYSNWEWATVCFSESFESLSEGMQIALWQLGAVPNAHRTDQLSAAVCQLPNPEVFTRRYQGLLDHYGLSAQKTQAGHANENGDVEQSHHRFKECADQALMLRGSRDFNDRSEYVAFLEELLSQKNAGRRERLAQELAVMRPLPAGRLASYKHLRGLRVSRGSLIHVDRNVYSVASRMIGEKVDARLYAEQVQVWYGQRKVDEFPRLRGRGKIHINYRHLIDWLVRKPGAFENYRYRDHLFPTSRFRVAYDAFREQSRATASRRYLKVLELAAKDSEWLVDQGIAHLLATGQSIDENTIEKFVTKGQVIRNVAEVNVDPVNLSIFDELYSEQEHATTKEVVA